MKTLGIIVLLLLVLFFGGCALTALVFSPQAGVLIVVALVAAGLCFACIMGIRALSRKPDVAAPKAELPDQDAPPP